MVDLDELQKDYAGKLTKALKHLRYSYDKVRRLPTDPAKLSEGQLETWESFSARFARSVDLFLTKYLRSLVLKNDPGFEGSLRDFIDQAEKLGLIQDADRWMAMRELRNITAHEYTEEELADFFRDSRKSAAEVLAVAKLIKAAKK